jgi:hypothetical protein
MALENECLFVELSPENVHPWQTKKKGMGYDRVNCTSSPSSIQCDPNIQIKDYKYIIGLLSSPNWHLKHVSLGSKGTGT